MEIALIAAIAKDRAIGMNNTLLWHLPNDLKRFKELTTGHTIMMGRKTFESLPNGALPNRRNVVVSRKLETSLQDVEVFPSLEMAIATLSLDCSQCFVIGGGDIYSQTIDLASSIHLTIVDAEYPHADTFFPELNWSDWDIVCEEYIPADERNPIASTYYNLTRR